MKKILLLLYFVCLAIAAGAQDNYEPKADPKAVVESGCARFTVLTPQMIRIQYSKERKFEDRATFAVVNRRLPVPSYSKREDDTFLYISTDALELRYRKNAEINAADKNPDALSITFKLNGRKVVWYPGKDDALNLKGTTRTLDGCIGDSKRPELENGLLSRAGWSVIDESYSARRGDGSRTFAFDGNVNGMPWVAPLVDKTAVDWYFLGYGHEYRKALHDYTLIGGKQPMPPLFVLGYWYSKYQRYSQQDFVDIVTDIKKNHIPIDVMILDMDWHTEGWTGWTWNKELIPDPQGLLRWMHGQGLKVSMNLHPADGVDSDEENFSLLAKDMGMDPTTAKVVPWQLESPLFYKNMFKDIIHHREKDGVDFWWLDWQQNLTNPRMDGLSETFWCNHVFYNDMRITHPELRPLIFHRWGGLGSHRYPIGFSGDSFSTFPTLAFQPYFTATAANVCFGYWGHDLGGHQHGNNDPELYLRWMQYGVFSPLFRTHATNDPKIEMRIWKYPNFKDLLQTVKLRYELMPYIYTAARQAYDTGVSICRPLYYDHPEENNAYRYEDEYMFGDDILVAPVLTAGKNGKTDRKIWLPEGKWFDVCRNKVVEGDREFTDSYTQTEIPYFYKAGSVIVNYENVMNLNSRPDRIILKVVPGADGSSTLYEDENNTEGYKSGLFTNTRFDQKRTSGSITLTINAREGSFPGMPEKRDYTVRLLATSAPKAVSLDGKRLDGSKWTYDKATRTVNINLTGIPCDRKTVVKVSVGK